MIWLVPAIAGGICLIGFVALWRMYVWETKPKRLTGAALQAYITELEYDTGIVQRPSVVGPRMTMRYLENMVAQGVTPAEWSSRMAQIDALRDPLGRFDNNGKRITNIRVGTHDLGPR